MKKIFFSFLIAALVLPTAAFAAFSDVSSFHQYYDAITWMEDNDVVEGYDDGTFRPADEVTRVAFLKMMQLTLGIQYSTTVDSLVSGVFSDTPVTEWYAPYVIWAKETGIVNGYDDGTFRPANAVNVAEAMKIVMNGFFDVDDLYGSGNIYSPCYGFTDGDLRKKGDVNAWYWKYVYVADSYCIIPEAMVESFDPSANLTRGEMAELLYRAKAVKDQAEASSGLMEDFDAEEEVGEIEEVEVASDEVGADSNNSGSGSSSNVVAVADPCSEDPEVLANGRVVFPVFEKYEHLPFLGQIFTVYDCGGGDKVFDIFGVDDQGQYTLGVEFWIDFNPTPDLANEFWEKGFRCGDKVGLAVCQHWVLEEDIGTSELLFLRPYHSELERDECLFCG
jgi:hypothetical protein